MSESVIAEEYSVYRQNVLIIQSEQGGEFWLDPDQQGFLSYDEFKEYYILALVGKDNYVDNLAQKIQYQSLVKEA